MNKKKIEDYLKLPWTYIVKTEREKGRSFFIISVEELPGISSDGETLEEAYENVQEALHAAIALYIKLGDEIPVPIDKNRFKGNLAYRTTPQRHYQLAAEAKRRHVSLSKMLDYAVDHTLARV